MHTSSTPRFLISVGDLRDRVLADARSVDIVEVRRDLTGRQPPRGQRQHDLIDPIQPALPLANDLRIERPVPIPRDLDLDRTDLGEHRLRAFPVARVLTGRGRVLLVAEVLGHLRLERCLQHGLREPAQQASRPDEADTLFLRLRKQLLGDLLLIDDLPGHRIDHLDGLAHSPFHSVKPDQIHRFADSPAGQDRTVTPACGCTAWSRRWASRWPSLERACSSSSLGVGRIRVIEKTVAHIP